MVNRSVVIGNSLENTCKKFMDDIMDQFDLPAIAVGVYFRGEKFTGTRSSSYLDQGPINPDTIFHYASVSKLFTSSAIMKLVEEGKLNLYDRLVDLLPELTTKMDEAYFREIRLWNMLTHTSGLGDVPDYCWDKPRSDNKALSDYVLSSPDVLDNPMLWPPQDTPEFYCPVTDEDGNPANRFRYSNVAFEILGYIIERYSGMSYEDFIAKRFFEPLGMTDSTMKTFERCDYNNPVARHSCNMADPFEKDSNGSIQPVVFYPYNREHGPSSTLTSNLGDLLKWGLGHMNHKPRILQEETYYTIWRHYATVPNNGEHMGIGWFMREQKEYKLFGHEGSDDGFRSSFWICPGLDMVTVILSNLSQAPVKKINKRLFEALV